MNWRNHIIGSLILYSILIFINLKNNLLNLNIIQILILGVVFIIAGLISDIDHKSSKIHNFVMVLGLIGIVISMYSNQNLIAVIVALMLVLIKNIPHRSITHKLEFGIILGLILAYFLNSIYGIFAFLGFLSHLFLDFLADNFGIGKR